MMEGTEKFMREREAKRDTNPPMWVWFGDKAKKGGLLQALHMGGRRPWFLQALFLSQLILSKSYIFPL